MQTHGERRGDRGNLCLARRPAGWSGRRTRSKARRRRPPSARPQGPPAARRALQQARADHQPLLRLHRRLRRLRRGGGATAHPPPPLPRASRRLACDSAGELSQHGGTHLGSAKENTPIFPGNNVMNFMCICFMTLEFPQIIKKIYPSPSRYSRLRWSC